MSGIVSFGGEIKKLDSHLMHETEELRHCQARMEQKNIFLHIREITIKHMVAYNWESGTHFLEFVCMPLWRGGGESRSIFNRNGCKTY